MEAGGGIGGPSGRRGPWARALVVLMGAVSRRLAEVRLRRRSVGRCVLVFWRRVVVLVLFLLHSYVACMELLMSLTVKITNESDDFYECQIVFLCSVSRVEAIVPNLDLFGDMNAILCSAVLSLIVAAEIFMP